MHCCSLSIANFEQILYNALVFLLLTLNKFDIGTSVSTRNFDEQNSVFFLTELEQISDTALTSFMLL